MKRMHYPNILIIADIEGSSGCRSYNDSRLCTKGWAGACVDMSLDIDAVVRALFKHGAESVRVKDFHRTGYNLLPELIDSRADIVPGYSAGPIPGIGDPGKAQAALFIGMHAASGSQGFLPHTLTSSIKEIQYNSRRLSEIEIFASSLAPFGLVPLMISGDREAVNDSKNVEGLTHCIIDRFAPEFSKKSYRELLARKAVESVTNSGRSEPFFMEAPYKADVTMMRRSDAQKLASRWNLEMIGEKTFSVKGKNYEELHFNLLKIFYLTPLSIKILPFSLLLFNLFGRYSLDWARRRIDKEV